MSFNLDVIICTHNPRPDYLQRTLESLKNQTLDKGQWRLILVDNASDIPLEKKWDIRWHPSSMHIQAPDLGLTNARLAGIEAAQADLLVFVDDDNVLALDYLEQVIRLAAEMPMIGSFGGQIVGIYENFLPQWLEPYVEALAVRDLRRSVWSNRYSWETCPAGAGMALRSPIAKQYVSALKQGNLKKMLGRKGKHLASAEDVDMAFTGIDMGYGMGRFMELQLSHLIDAKRMRKKYILKLTESTAFSQVILDSFREEKLLLDSIPALDILKQLYRLVFRSYFEFQMGRARLKGLKQGRLFLKNNKLISTR